MLFLAFLSRGDNAAFFQDPKVARDSRSRGILESGGDVAGERWPFLAKQVENLSSCRIRNRGVRVSIIRQGHEALRDA